MSGSRRIGKKAHSQLENDLPKKQKASILLAVSDQPTNTDPINVELRAKNADLRSELTIFKTENALLRQKIDLLIRHVFGSKSEKLDPAQLELLLGGAANEDEPKKDEASAELEAIPASCKAPSPRSGRNKPRWPADLPVEETIIEPELVLAAPQDWRLIGSEVSEQLDYQPAKFLCRRTIRRKYVHRHDPDLAPIIAPLPEILQERCVAAPGLIAQVLVAKYCDHLPLYRQEQIYWRRHEVWLPRQSLARWVGLAADWLRPIAEAIKTNILLKGYVQVDETPIRYLDPGKGKTSQGYLWVVSRPGGDVSFSWETSRAATCLEKIIPVDFHGVLQCDGYAAYPCFAGRRDPNTKSSMKVDREARITLAGCWAHVRRGFHEAQDQASRQVGWVLRQIAQLYRIESQLREQKAGPQLRQAVRSSHSRMIHRRLHAALLRWKLRSRILPQSSFGKAIDYALGQWPAMGVYLEDGRVEIDNNLVENAIRPTAIGKKNWLFIGDAGAGERSAIIYTIIESCRRQQIDPLAYLRDVLTRLPTMTNWQIPTITPAAWAKAQKARATASRQAA